MNKHQIIESLSLVEHVEGGYFAETHRSPATLSTDRSGGDRSLLTSIYYLLTDERPIDHFHKNQSDILHYFHLGSPITYLVLHPDGKLENIKMGANLARGEVLQLLVPGGCWKAAVLEAGEFGLIGEAVTPGFDYRDMELATADKLKTQFPELWDSLAPYVHSSSGI